MAGGGMEKKIVRLILMACQPVKGHFMLRGCRITFIEDSY